MLIERTQLRVQVAALLAQFRGVLLIGPRQVGETTLARTFVPAASPNYFDLEAPVVAEQFRTPKTLLSELRGLVVIDEVQHAPHDLPLLRVLMDCEAAPAKFLVLGSASMPLLRQGSESLPGRIAVVEVGGFTLQEVGIAQEQALWWRGGAPLSFLAAQDEQSLEWRARFIDLFLDENIGKRQVKAPKIYFRDSGLLHSLMGIRSRDELRVHPKSGASWEGFALEQVLRLAQPEDAYFWATHTGAELDLLMFKYGKRVGVEFSRVDAPRLTPSLRTAMADLTLDALYVVSPGDRRYTMADRVEAVPLAHFAGAA